MHLLGLSCVTDGVVDKVLPHIVERWAERVRLLNIYGPTEATVVCVVNEVKSRTESGDIIGRPFGQTRVYVLDDKQQLVPPGGVGELCLAGPQVRFCARSAPAALTLSSSWHAATSRTSKRRRPRLCRIRLWRASGCIARATWCACAATARWRSADASTRRSSCTACASRRARWTARCCRTAAWRRATRRWWCVLLTLILEMSVR